MWSRFKWPADGLMDDHGHQFDLSKKLQSEGVPSQPACIPRDQSPHHSKYDVLEFEMALPTPVDAAEVQSFCLRVFPATYDDGWFGFMLACDTVYKICYRHEGKIVALIVGQVARRDAWNEVLQSSSDISRTMEHEKITAYIMLLGVDESFRRCGLGSKLLVSFLRTVSAAWPSVPRSFFLHVAVENSAAIRMYRNHGFRRMQLLPHYYDYGKRDAAPDLHDAYLYVKDIDTSLAGEFLDSLWDCLTCTTVSGLTLIQRMISVAALPVQYAFSCAKNFFSFPVQKFAPVDPQLAKLV